MSASGGGGPAERYTHGHHDSVLRSHAWRTVANSAPHLVPRLRPGQRVLDVGCGPGTITADLADRVAPGPVIGLDRSPTVLRVAAGATGAHPPRYVAGDVYALHFADDSFDVVHAHQVLQHLGDPVAALIEMRRVCRPDGVVAVRDADYATFGWTPADPVLDRWLDRYRAAHRASGGEPDAGRHLWRWARAAGFSRIEPSASAWCFATPEDRRWWGGTWAERVVSSDVADRMRELGMDGRELDAIAEAWRRWAEDPDACFVLPSVEVLASP